MAYGIQTINASSETTLTADSSILRYLGMFILPESYPNWTTVYCPIISGKDVIFIGETWQKQYYTNGILFSRVDDTHFNYLSGNGMIIAHLYAWS